jgi:hypothetical protein
MADKDEIKSALLARLETKEELAEYAARMEVDRDYWESRYDELLSEIGGVWPR